MAKIGVIGSGSWGIALAKLLYDNHHEITVWSAIVSEIESLQNTHKLSTLPELVLPEEMCFTADLEEAMKDKDVLVLAVPSIYVRSTAARMKEF